MSDFQLEPGIAGFLFKQFSRELQGKIVRQLYNAKVHVQPDATNDSVYITIKHKVLPIEYTENLSEITSCIQDEAENDGVIRDLARTIVGNYKDHIWHMFFYDYKKRQEKKEEKPVKPIDSIEEHIIQCHNDGYSDEQIAQMLNIDISTVISVYQTMQANNSVEE